MTHNIEDIVETPTHGGQISAGATLKSNFIATNGKPEWKWVRSYCRCDFCRQQRAQWYRIVVQGQPE